MSSGDRCDRVGVFVFSSPRSTTRKHRSAPHWLEINSCFAFLCSSVAVSFAWRTDRLKFGPSSQGACGACLTRPSKVSNSPNHASAPGPRRLGPGINERGSFATCTPHQIKPSRATATDRHACVYRINDFSSSVNNDGETDKRVGRSQRRRRRTNELSDSTTGRTWSPEVRLIKQRPGMKSYFLPLFFHKQFWHLLRFKF